MAIVTVAPKELPLIPVKMERQLFSFQAFIPSECASYLTIVAPHGNPSKRASVDRLDPGQRA
jgi:ureidoglycolate hydrolase